MTPSSKKFTKEYAKELLSIAGGDLRTAKVLIDHPLGRPENTFFVIQQVVEKSLKAVLCHSNIAIPLTHDIGALLAMLPESCPRPPDERPLIGLTEFASIRRYEEGKYEFTTEEFKATYQIAEGLLKWASQRVGS